ncbi:hypothetical protein MKW94_003320 [Papaver nudicaule]|uniref:Bowman-Birk serine protease inhibitors family domain-containing protein n=1 Tax=Papaver nudicaule TaxID=74823 RepID=A0AA42B3V1_PAPNU|nr:hypothetical protein [Papaver nudicaule]
MAQKMAVSRASLVLTALMMLAIVVAISSPTVVDAAGCCNLCPCTKSAIPQCRCSDIKDHCHSECKSCVCTKSIPPQCRCADVNNFCYPKC